MISSLCNKRRITLLELLTTLSTVVILLTLALPSLAQLQTESGTQPLLKCSDDLSESYDLRP